MWTASVMKSNMYHLTAVSSPITDRTNVDCPGSIRRWGQYVSAAALEVEVLPVKAAVVGSTPGHAGGRTLRHPGASQQTATHQWGELWVWNQGSEKTMTKIQHVKERLCGFVDWELTEGFHPQVRKYSRCICVHISMNVSDQEGECRYKTSRSDQRHFSSSFPTGCCSNAPWAWGTSYEFQGTPHNSR